MIGFTCLFGFLADRIALPLSFGAGAAWRATLLQALDTEAETLKQNAKISLPRASMTSVSHLNLTLQPNPAAVWLYSCVRAA